VSFGLTDNLLFAAFIAAVMVFVFARKFLPIRIAFWTAFIKAGFPLVYFAFFYDGKWTFSDDQYYLYVGQELISKQFHPFTIFFSKIGMGTLFSLSHGTHIMYGWWNFLAESLFGSFYYAPVFLNVGLTAIGGYYMYSIGMIAGFKRNYCQYLAVFFMLHWDVLAWSSICNLKDTMVLTVTIAIVYYMLCIGLMIRHGRQLLFSAIGLILTLSIMIWLRSYVALVLTGVFVLWITSNVSGKTRYIMLGGGILLAGLVGMKMPGLSSQLSSVLNPMKCIGGLVRFALTPRPWGLDQKYGFLILPACLHWLHLIPAIVGGWYLWKRSSATRFLILYILVASLLYGGVDVLQGPRHRVQLTFVLAWMQFHFLYLCAVSARHRASNAQNLLVETTTQPI